MKHMALLTAAALAPLSAVAQSPPVAISPGFGSATDTSGNVWAISPSGSVRENGQWVAGGGGTAVLVVAGDTVYGLDAHGRGWFTFGTAAQAWSHASAPAGATTPTTAAAVSDAIVQATTANTSLPSVASATAALAPFGCGSTSATDQHFGILPLQAGGPGRIVAPDGLVFVPRGIGIMEGQEPSVDLLQATFPGINFVRYALYAYPPPEKIASWVNALTQAGIVVEIENHNNGTGANWGGAQGSVFTGQQLANESRWYASVASSFKSNARVWFGTNNEPPGPAGLSAWHKATYDAIRGAGNNTIIMIDPTGGYLTDGLDAGVYAQMTNVAWDIHYYGWGPRYATDAGTVRATLSQWIHTVQSLKSAGGTTMPVIIGEYGDSTDGINVDANGILVIQAVSDAVMAGSAAGSAAWVWAPPQPGDGLVQSLTGGLTSPYGTTIASYLKQAMDALSVCGSSALSTQAGGHVMQATLPVSETTPAADQTASATLPDAAVADNVSAQQSNDAADIILKNANAALSKVQR